MAANDPSQLQLTGQITQLDGLGQHNATVQVIRRILSEVHTATVVQVVACTNAGGVSPVGFVDVLPLVAQMDGSGSPVPHGVLHQLPYMRLQGGANAVIIDPQVGDIGIALFASRDISSVKASGAASHPASKRKFDMADGMYLGGVLNGTPSQYVQFSGAGVAITSPTAITLTAPNVTINASGNATINAGAMALSAAGAASIGAGTLGISSTGAATMSTGGGFTNNGVNIGATHTHGGVQTGSGNTGVPH